jgi:hypothetical protein
MARKRKGFLFEKREEKKKEMRISFRPMLLK